MKKINLYLILCVLFFVISCKKEDTVITVQDFDGNVYETVKIGNQIWMKQNLKTSHYNDGTPINSDLNDAAWHVTTSGAYAMYDNDVSKNDAYGKLYNWYAVNTGKLAPKGWHVPTKAEFTTLVDYLGGESVAGDKLKSLTLWIAPVSAASNSSGFSALPAGYRNWDGKYYSISERTYFLTSTADINTAWHFGLRNDESKVTNADYDKSYGYSIRCIKD